MKFILRKQLLFVFITLATAGVVAAQENGNRDEQNKVVRGPYETNRFLDNIFIGVGGGINIYEGEHDFRGKGHMKGRRIAPAFDIYVGKWFSPSFGGRIGYSGLSANGWAGCEKPGYVFGDKVDGAYRERFGFSYVHADLMWNISNTIGGYKETRTWNVVPFIGAGWARSFRLADRFLDNGEYLNENGKFDNELAVSLGILNNFRLCDLLDLTVEARQLFTRSHLDKRPGDGKNGTNGALHNNMDGMTSVTVGLSFKFPQRGFRRVQAPVDITSYVSRIDELEKEQAALASANKALTDENTALKNRKPEVVTVPGEERINPVALFFYTGKATLENKDLTNLDLYVKEALKANPEKIFTIYAGADKAKSPDDAAKKLCEQRVQYLSDILTDKYGISKDSLRVAGESDFENGLPESKLNRTIFVVE